MLQGCIAKAKKLPKLSPETKADIEAFEVKLAAIAAEKREEQATAEAALKPAAGPEDMDTSDGEELTSFVNPPPSHPRPPPKCHHQAVFQHWLCCQLVCENSDSFRGNACGTLSVKLAGTSKQCML